MADAVLFDLDDTLLDGSGHLEAIRQACVEVGESTGVDGDRLFSANADEWGRYWPTVESDWTLGGLTGEAVTREGWRRTLLACGLSGSLAQMAADAHRRHLHARIRLHDDVSSVLEALDRDYRLGLVTNGASDTQRAAIRICGLEARFSAVVVSGEVGVAKPDRSVFLLAAEKLRVQPAQTVHVGDNLQTDVAGALAGGMVAVWVNRRGARRSPDDPEPHHEISSLSELPAFLESTA